MRRERAGGPGGRWTILLAAAAGTVAWPSALRAQEARIGIARGATPVPVVLEDVAGGEVDLGEHMGHAPVLLEFWAMWCENCQALHPRMLDAYHRYGDRVRFFAVAVAVGQSKDRIRGHLERHSVPWPTLWDATGAAVRAFEAPATSYLVILDGDGRVAYTGLGRDQDVVQALRMVVPDEPAGRGNGP